MKHISINKNVIKMGKKVFLNILLVAIIFASCKNKKDDNSRFAAIIESSEWIKKVESHALVINSSELKEVPYSEFNKLIKDIKYIPLQSKEPIGIIEQIAIYRDRIFVLDAFKSEMVYVFDFSGSLINVIHSKGAGPEEYLGLVDLSISKRNSEVVINDRLSLHTLYYSLDGDFVKKVKRAPNFYFEMMDDKCVNQLTFGQSYSEEVNYHIVISQEDSIIRKGFPFYPLQINAVSSKSLAYNNKGELLFSPTLSDTIYHIINDSLYSIKYVVNQEKSIWSEKDKDLSTDEYRNLVKHDGYTYLGKPVLECDSYLCYPIATGSNGYIQSKICWYDKVKKFSFVVESQNEKDAPIDAYLPKPLTVCDDYFVGVIGIEEIDALKNYVKQEGKTEMFKDEKFKSILTKGIDNLEGILVLYSFK